MAIAGIILAVIMGNALAGATTIGYHAECIDGIDNNGDGLADGQDQECTEYPFEDGNGESHTPPEERSTSSDEYSSWFEYHRDYMTGSQLEGTVCFNIQSQPGGYDADDLEAAQEWVAQNGLNCESGGP
jgi:hypothetical protein